MTAEIREKHVLIILALFCVSSKVDAQERRLAMCDQFQRCYYVSPLCGLLYQYFRCEDLQPRDISCGLSVVTGSASTYTMPRIVGGLDAVDNEFPWSVRLRDEGGVMGLCGGTILDKNTILTAAHCVSSLVNRLADLTIGYGSVRRSILTYIRADRIDIHPSYIPNTNSDNDIAVVTLGDDIPLNRNFPSVCLPPPSQTYSTGRTCIVTGWGRTQEGGFTFPDILQKAAVPLVPLGVCQQAYINYSSLLVAERQLCAGYYIDGGTDACQGDSGGPLVCPEGDRWVIYGIVSIGNGCGRSRFPGVYTYVPQYIDWIRSLMN